MAANEAKFDCRKCHDECGQECLLDKFMNDKSFKFHWNAYQVWKSKSVLPEAGGYADLWNVFVESFDTIRHYEAIEAEKQAERDIRKANRNRQKAFATKQARAA